MELKDKKILITGATGSLGKQLIYQLLKEGIRPYAQVRQASNAAYIDTHKLIKRTADLCFPDQLDALVKGMDAIIHTAAWVNFRQDRLTQFMAINTQAAVNLFKAADKAGVKRFVHVSTIAAIGAVPFTNLDGNADPHELQTANEDTEFNLDHLRIPYIMTKRAAEVELLKQAKDSKTELVIVNPAMIVAPSRTGDDRSKATKAMSRFIIPGQHNRLNLCDIRDVAVGVIRALEKGKPGQRYILGGDDISVRELMLAISSMLKKAPHVLTFPRWLLNFLARTCFIWCKLTGRRKISFYPDLIRMLDYDWAYSSLKARKKLGYNPRSIFDTFEDLLNNDFKGTWMRE